MSIFNEDELVPPSWINQVFIQNVLNQYEKSGNAKLHDFDITPACLKGDHFGSIMFRCKVFYNLEGLKELKKISFIIKTIPEEKCFKNELLEGAGVFETEISMYSETLPKIEEILNDCGEPTKMAAKLVFHSLKPHKVIVMEDLCEAGYSILRGRYLTEDEVKLVFRKIAQFHAVTFMLGDSTNHEIVSKYQEGLFNKEVVMSMDLLQNGIGHFVELLNSNKEFAIYLEKVKIMQPHMMSECMKLYSAYNLNKKSGGIFVLNHGDVHMKNLMFKFNEISKQIEDVVMVDYQMSCFAPSTIDTTYLQFHILSPELRLKKNEFMFYYFTEFIRVLKKLKCDKNLPLYSDFQIASYKYRYLALFLLSTLLPLFSRVLISEPEDLKENDASKILEDTDLISSYYKLTNYLEDLRNYLPLLLTEGYLD